MIYVNDILIVGDCPFIDKFILKLNIVFSLKDLGLLNYYLGVEAFQTSAGMYLLQRTYIVDRLDCADLSHVRHCSTHVITSRHLSAFEGDLTSNLNLYRNILGALQYLTHTRPDISYIVKKLSQFPQRPTSLQWQVVKRVIWYLKGTIEYGLFLPNAEQNNLVAYTDANWAY